MEKHIDSIKWKNALVLSNTILLTSTSEGDLIVEIIKVKPSLYISRKDRKHMVANMFFKLFIYVLVFK